ncbi:MAG TPA: hypothetical protein DCX03_03595 [Bacteroidales bacterium]|nr:hypothetical protein [Bacteroidales bacterium]
MRKRIREHVIILKHEGFDWEMMRSLFPPGDPRSLNDQFQVVTITCKSKQEDLMLYNLVYTNGKSENELASISGLNTDEVNNFITKLDKFDLLEKVDENTHLSASEIDRYNRQLRLFSLIAAPTEIQEKMKQAKIVIVGLGGIGGWLLYNLASVGIGNIIGYDHDNVELSNLNRQILFSESDIGKPKAEAARERILSYNSTINFETQVLEITENNIESCIPSDTSAFVSTVYPIEHYANKYCVQNGIPTLAQGGGKYSPTGVTVMIPGRTGCFDCAKDFRAEWKQLFTLVRARHGNNYAPTTTFSPFISLCSNIMAIEIFKLVTGFSEPMNRIFIDPITWEIDINKNYLERRTDCETCGKYWR